MTIILSICMSSIVYGMPPTPSLDDALTVSVGFNNVLDEDPPVCFPWGVIGLSTVAHDLPGRAGYVKVTYERQLAVN